MMRLRSPVKGNRRQQVNPEPGADVVQSYLFPVCDEIMALGVDRLAEVHQYVQHEEYINSPNKAVE